MKDQLYQNSGLYLKRSLSSREKPVKRVAFPGRGGLKWPCPITVFFLISAKQRLLLSDVRLGSSVGKPDSCGFLSRLVVRAQFEPLRHSQFALDGDGPWSVAVVVLQVS